MTKLRFTGTLRNMGKGAWTLLVFPADVSEKLGTRGRVPIVGTLNGAPFRASALPVGDGTHQLPVTKEMQNAAGVGDGDEVTIELEVDTAPREVEVPPELTAALRRVKGAKAAFEKMAPSHRKQWAQHVAEAKQEETRKRRAEKAAERIAGGEKSMK